MNTLISKLGFIYNMLKYKYRFKKSGRFYISSYSSIIGANMISLGNTFFANRFLRLEVFGTNKEIKLQIGNRVGLGESVHIGVSNFVEIGDNVLIGSRVLITDHNHGEYTSLNPSSPFEAPAIRQIHSAGPVIIGENVWIGDGVVILPNVKIGFGCVIAANTVVTKDLPAMTIAGGNPCRILKVYNSDLKRWEKIDNSPKINL